MPFTTGNENIILIINIINKSMFKRNSSRPITCLIKSERFRFANSLEWGSAYAFKKFKNFLKDLLVINCPIAEIIKGFVVKINLAHLLTRRSLTSASNSSPENVTVFLFLSRFSIALITRSLYAFYLLFLSIQNQIPMKLKFQ